MKTILSILTIVLFSNLITAQTSIPDANFEQALINLGLDIGTPNGTVPTANIDTLTNLYLAFENITNLYGIQDFSSLESLNCSYNQLTNIDISQNTALKVFDCSANQLTTIDITQNIDLIYFNSYYNPLSSIDVTKNTVLKSLDVSHNSLTNIDVTKNTDLLHLSVYNNLLTDINITQNTLLISLFCSNNSLSIISIAQQTSLTRLRCENNQLTCLNVKNGNNANFTIFTTEDNPNLTCIEVDDIASSTTNWIGIDFSFDLVAVFSEDCINICSTLGLTELSTLSISIYPNPSTGSINIDLEETKSNVNLRLTNAIGQVILTENYKSTNHINFDINAPKGIYFLQLVTANGEIMTIKIIKE